MGWFSSKSSSSDNSAEAVEYRAAKKALAEDPVNTGQLGYVSADSPAGRRNLDAQDRLNNAESSYEARKTTRRW